MFTYQVGGSHCLCPWPSRSGYKIEKVPRDRHAPHGIHKSLAGARSWRSWRWAWRNREAYPNHGRFPWNYCLEHKSQPNTWRVLNTSAEHESNDQRQQQLETQLSSLQCCHGEASNSSDWPVCQSNQQLTPKLGAMAMDAFTISWKVG